MKTEHLIVLPMEPFPVGSGYPSGQSLPLHCTVMDWFTRGPGLTLPALSQRIERIAGGIEADSIELVSDHGALFGPDNDVPVHVLAENEPLVLLHNQIFTYLAATQCDFKVLKWVGAGYHPHVTGSQSFLPGSHHRPQSLALIGRGKGGAQTVIADTAFGRTC